MVYKPNLPKRYKKVIFSVPENSDKYSKVGALVTIDLKFIRNEYKFPKYIVNDLVSLVSDLINSKELNNELGRLIFENAKESIGLLGELFYKISKRDKVALLSYCMARIKVSESIYETGVSCAILEHIIASTKIDYEPSIPFERRLIDKISRVLINDKKDMKKILEDYISAVRFYSTIPEELNSIINLSIKIATKRREHSQNDSKR